MPNPSRRYLDEASGLLDDEVTGPRRTRVAGALEARDNRYSQLERALAETEARVRYLELKLARKNAEILAKGAVIDEPAEDPHAGR